MSRISCGRGLHVVISSRDPSGIKIITRNRNVVGTRTSVLCTEPWCSSDTPSWWPWRSHERPDFCRRCCYPCACLRGCCTFCRTVAAGGVRGAEAQEFMPAYYARVPQGGEDPVCKDDAGVHAQQLIP